MKNAVFYREYQYSDISPLFLLQLLFYQDLLSLYKASPHKCIINLIYKANLGNHILKFTFIDI